MASYPRKEIQMPQSKAKARAGYEARANNIIAGQAGPVLTALLDVIADLGPENEGLSAFAQDARYALELSYRIDRAIVLTGIPELLDGPIAFLVALAAVGIWRAEVRRAGMIARRKEAALLQLERAEQSGRTKREAAIRRRLRNISNIGE